MNLKICYIVFLCSFIGLSQSIEIKGTITHKNTPIPFVNVYVKNKNKGTMTDENGQYSFNVHSATYTLVVQSIGYKTIERKITVADESLTINFNLEEDPLGLDQVVVSATRTALNRREAPVLVTVTNAESLKKVQATTLFEGLNF
ncbi:hypothetical protein EZY14_018045 [Kordia sp. TARA_039_SRF]|nr:hypothetical protein EZY14_018045 [Kordia sp. TARA_039_SRF]